MVQDAHYNYFLNQIGRNISALITRQWFSHINTEGNFETVVKVMKTFAIFPKGVEGDLNPNSK